MTTCTKPCAARMADTFDANVSVDLECPDCPAGMVAIRDAECELVAFVPTEKASALVAWLNWSAYHAPNHYDVCEPRSGE